MGLNWIAGVLTTPIARSRRDLQNLPRNLGRKLPKSEVWAPQHTKPSIFSPPHVPAFCPPWVARARAVCKFVGKWGFRPHQSLDLTKIYNIFHATWVWNLQKVHLGPRNTPNRPFSVRHKSPRSAHPGWRARARAGCARSSEMGVSAK